MITTCAWCGKTIAKSPGRGVSHGICRTCESRIRAEMELAATPNPHLQTSPHGYCYWYDLTDARHPHNQHPNTPQPTVTQ